LLVEIKAIYKTDDTHITIIVFVLDVQ
jgi:hypothetical protein